MIADIEAVGVDATWCLGDLVGYGAQPDECVALARAAADLCLVGNHDLVVIDRLDSSTFSTHAAEAAQWTKDHISRDAVGFLEGLSAADADGPVALYHGSPRDHVWEYLLSNAAADASMDAMDHRIGAVGHSHVALVFRRLPGGRAVGEVAPAGTSVDLSEGELILNPGAVGQPRDGDPRAAWLLLELEEARATWRRVEYPIEAAAAAIRSAGLPVMLAERLHYGQ